MRNSGPGAGVLHFSTLDDFFIPHAVLMDEFTVHAVGNDFYLLVRVRFKPGTGLQSEIIERDQIPKVGIAGVLIVSKREVETSNMPTIIFEVNLRCGNLGKHILQD